MCDRMLPDPRKQRDLVLFEIPPRIPDIVGAGESNKGATLLASARLSSSIRLRSGRMA